MTGLTAPAEPALRWVVAVVRDLGDRLVATGMAEDRPRALMLAVALVEAFPHVDRAGVAQPPAAADAAATSHGPRRDRGP